MPILATLITLGTAAASMASKKIASDKKEAKMKKDQMKQNFSMPEMNKGYSDGPNSIGAVLGKIGQVAAKVGKYASENPEITKAAIGATTTLASEAMQHRKNQKQGAYMKGSEMNGKEPYMMGFNPLSKHMGGRGANMMGKDERKTKKAMKQDAKSAPEKMPTKQAKSVTSTPEKDSVISGFRLRSEHPVGLYRSQEEHSRGVQGTQASVSGMPYIGMTDKEKAYGVNWVKGYKK